MKKCSLCSQTISINDFYFRSKKAGTRQSACKKCRNLQMNKAKQTPARKFKEYKYEASRRNINFELTFEQFSKFYKKDCRYCGTSILSIGLDRLNNDLGYTMDNVVSSCYPCNILKSTQDEEKFLNHINKIFVYQQKVKNDK